LGSSRPPPTGLARWGVAGVATDVTVI
jgi:hypothetical protein